jgi:hypothetical protein
MSRASKFGVALIEHRIGPAMMDGLDYEDPVTVAGDQIAYWLHWVASQVAEDADPIEQVELALSAAWYHFEAEHDEGDDFSNDPHYDEMRYRLYERNPLRDASGVRRD